MQHLNKIKLWNLLTQQQRKDIRTKFGIKPTGSKEIVDNQIIRDGVQENDLSEVPKEAILNQLGVYSEENNYAQKTEDENSESNDEENVQYNYPGSGSGSKTGQKQGVS